MQTFLKEISDTFGTSVLPTLLLHSVKKKNRMQCMCMSIVVLTVLYYLLSFLDYVHVLCRLAVGVSEAGEDGL